MPIKGEFDISQLKADLEDAGYTVVSVGKRYRVTNPAGGEPAFMPQALPKNGRATTIADIERVLARIGFDRAQAEQAREARRQERLGRAQRDGDAALAKAQAEAAARPSPADVQKVIRQRVSAEASTSAPDLPAEPRTDILTLDADFAAELLKHNLFYDRKGKFDPEAGAQRTNRPFSQDRAERYRDAMLRGEWKLTHQGIALDRDGLLVDGQHRLIGLVLAAEQKPGLTIRTQVTYDLEPEAFDAVDIGGKRTVADILGAHGEKTTAVLAAVARLVAFFDQRKTPSSWGRSTLTPDEALVIIRDQPEIRDAAKWGTNGNIALPAAEGAARHLIMRECGDAGRRFARQFFEGYRTGAGLEIGTPALTLRNVVLNQAADRKRKRHSLEQTALIIKAWNAEAAGKQQKVLAWRVTEELPRVIGVR